MGFNVSGITSEQIKARESEFVETWKAKSEAERNEYKRNINKMREVWDSSWPWEWCAFQRAFGL
jgi:hypothetical protein